MVVNDYTVRMTDPFATFDLPQRFDIDVESLSHRFFALCTEHHPDRFTDPIDQVEASERTARINESHRVLTDPEQRANILLQLLGGAAKGDDKSLPPDLLVDMMDVRQQQEEAQANDDTQTLRKLTDWARSQRGAKAQPGGSSARSGGWPGIEARVLPTGPVRSGMLPRSPWV